MDPTNRTLDSMISVPHPSQVGDFIESQPGTSTEERPSKRRGIDHSQVLDDEDEEGAGSGDDDDDDGVSREHDHENTTTTNGAWTKKTVEIPESDCDFTSILELRQEAKKRENQGKLLYHLFEDSQHISINMDGQLIWAQRSKRSC